MRVLIIRGLSVLALLVALAWFFDGGEYEAVIAAIVGFVGLLSGEFMKGDRESTAHVRSGGPTSRLGYSEKGTPRDSILVLPFDNVSPDSEDAYFSDGLTDEIIMNLSRFRSIRVISRNSSMALKGSRRSTRDIAADLDVAFVLEGSVRKAGTELRITAQLIDAQSDQQLWAEKYDGSLDDIFGIQEEVSRSIVAALTLKLSPEEEQRLSERPIIDPTAHECYLRARHEYWKMTPQSLEEAHRHVQNGLEIVGENELLLATMGYVTVQRINFGLAPGPEHLPEAERLASKVLGINPDSAHGHTLLGWIRFAQGRPADAVAHLKTALAIDPNIFEAIAWMAITCLTAGKHEAAGAYVQELIRIDPLTPVNHSLLGYWHTLRGEKAKAVTVYQQTYDMDPDNPLTQILMGRMMVMLGEEGRARDPLERIARGDADQPLVRHGRILRHILSGDSDQAKAVITPDLEEVSYHDAYLAWWLGDWFASLEREQDAVRWLSRAAELGFINWPVLQEIDVFLDPIRGKPIFEEFLEDLRVRWEEFQP
jgi:adenylate cyclase